MRFILGVALALLVAASTAASTPVATGRVATIGALGGSPPDFELQASFGATRFGWSMRGDVLASRHDLGEPPGKSAAGIALAAPLTRGLSLEGLAIERFASGEFGARQFLGGARLIHAGDHGRVWLGHLNATSIRVAPSGGPVLQTGGDVAMGRLSLSGSLGWNSTTWHVMIPAQTAFVADTILVLVSPAREETRRSVGSMAQLGSGWSATRWSIAATGGVRWESALSTSSWLRVEGGWWLRPRLAMRAGVGREAADPWQFRSARRAASVALEWTRPRWETRASPATAPRAVTLRVVNVTGDLRRIEVTAPGAQRVEAMGDFTMWDAVELRRSSRGRFRFESHLAPGVYRVQVRRDGGPWMIPANLPGTDDPDLGEAGTLVIE